MDDDFPACSSRSGAEPGSGPASAPGASKTRLTPQDPFPADLSVLPLVLLHVLDSKVRRQLDHELLYALQCPHPLTLDRHHELVTEIDAREITGAGSAEYQSLLQ